MRDLPGATKEQPMKMRTVSSVLVASAVTLLGGAAFSGGQSTTVNQLVDFDASSGKLWGYPPNQSLATYQHTPTTRHLEADLVRFEPPDPCDELVHMWNYAVDYDRRFHMNSTPIFESLIGLMASNKCSAIVSVTSGSPPPIDSITPTSAK
jgi:hypothetical protein